MASCSLALEVGRHYSSFIAPKGIHVGTYRSLFAKTSQLKNDYAIQRSKTDVDERKKGAATCRATIDSDPSLRFSSQNEWSPENRVEGVGEEIAEENVIVKEKTLRLVETAMLAATAGLAYFVSNLLRLEAYLGCFFPLPVVVSCMRWGPRAGRKTMVSTAMLLMVLSGPLKAVSYLLMHGLVGWAMGSLWSWRVNWGLSIAICAVVRSIGALGFVMLSSFMLNENLLQLITINAHATFSYILAAVGVNMVPTMNMIYFVFAFLLLLNCGSFVFLLHVLYAIFLRRLERQYHQLYCQGRRLLLSGRLGCDLCFPGSMADRAGSVERFLVSIVVLASSRGHAVHAVMHPLDFVFVECLVAVEAYSIALGSSFAALTLRDRPCSQHPECLAVYNREQDTCVTLPIDRFIRCAGTKITPKQPRPEIFHTGNVFPLESTKIKLHKIR